jgi:hypothetical protein
MTGTHKQLGLLKPSNGTTEMGAVDSENLELISCNAPHPACCVDRLAVGRSYIRIPERSQPRLAFGKFAHGPEWYPGKVAVRPSAGNGRQQKSYDGYGKRGGHQAVEKNSQLHE